MRASAHPVQQFPARDSLHEPRRGTAAMPVCDLSQRFVRVLARRDDGFVEFAFSVGWPELSVELLLPVRDFDAFCQAHAVHMLPDADDTSRQGDKPQ